MTQPFNLAPAPQPVLLGRFRNVLVQQGKRAARSDETLLARSDDGRDKLFYVPFEQMNRMAKLVIVGISPGPKQIELAYDAVQARIKAGIPEATVLERAKREGSFGGPSMRPNLVRMLEFFGIPKLLRIDRAEDLWGSAWAYLHATSVVPHAAFRNDEPFALGFDEVLEHPAFRLTHIRHF
jgi:hypothetical protein